jgi:hypothetical protein
MALHRDIYWLGRQWAVTGLGLQLIDQKLQGFFDIEASRLWEEPLIAKMHAKEWLNRADFDKGLDLARTRYAQTPRATEPLPPTEEPISQLIDSILAAPARPAPKPDMPKHERLDPVAPPQPEPAVVLEVEPAKPEPAKPEPIELKPAEPVKLPEPSTPGFRLGLAGSARFLRPWRVKLKR